MSRVTSGSSTDTLSGTGSVTGMTCPSGRTYWPPGSWNQPHDPAVVVEVQRRPQPAELREARPTGRLRADGADPPRTVAHADHVAGAQLRRLAVDGERPLPAAELHEARHVDDDLRAVLDDGVILEQRAGALPPAQVARDAGVVGLDDDAQCTQRLGDLEAQRPDGEIGRVERREPRTRGTSAARRRAIDTEVSCTRRLG